MSRHRASALHFAISLALVALPLAAIFLAWYPGPLRALAVGPQMGFFAAAVVFGPLATWFVFRSGKRGLAMDLAIIALVQVAAVAAASFFLFGSRPVYIAFVKDRFEIVRANQYPEQELRRAAGSPWLAFPLDGPALVGTRIPDDPAERDHLLTLAMVGVDLSQVPMHYIAYDTVRPQVRTAGLTLDRLRSLNPQRTADIQALATRLGRGEEGLRYLPLRAGKKEFAAVIDAGNADVLDIEALRPWE